MAEGPVASVTSSGAFLAGSIITSALEKKAKGDAKDYHAIVAELCKDDIQDVKLGRWLQGLSNCISSLSHSCEKLVGAALQVPWAHRGDTAVRQYIEFLSDLVSAHAEFLSPCLYMLASLLVYDADVSSEANQQVFDRAHRALQQVVQLVPVGHRCLKEHLTALCPYKGHAREIQEHFIRNLLQIIEYQPALEVDILDIIISHLIKFDVHISKEDLEEEEDDEENMQFEVELDTPASKPDKDASSFHMADETADKLDVLIELVFSYINKKCYLGDGSSRSSSLNLEAATHVFQTFLILFERLLLPTHATSHTQYLLFYICSFHQSFSEGFLHSLWTKVTDLNVPGVVRQAAVAYMASLVARASFLPQSTAETCLELMNHWILRYIEDCDTSVRSSTMLTMHNVFYAVCQALFYIFIFRHKQLLGTEDGVARVKRLNFERIVSCHLNPLQVCLPTVAEMFASIGSHHQIVFCFTIIERNRRILLPTTSSPSAAASTDAANNQLDSFFPFDPYLLKRSSVFIKGIYQEWKNVAPRTVSISQDDDDDDDSESVTESESTLLSLSEADSSHFSPSVTAMCISPGFMPSSPRAHRQHKHH